MALRCDGEPSTLALLESVKRACAGMRIVVHSEPSPTGDHQSNGAAEAIVGVLRQKAKLLVSKIEEATACGGAIFSCLHPAYCCAQCMASQSLFSEAIDDGLREKHR